jgi:hypothetical protein
MASSASLVSSATESYYCLKKKYGDYFETKKWGMVLIAMQPNVSKQFHSDD